MRAKVMGRARLTKKLRKLAPEAEKSYAKAIELGAKELASAIRAAAPSDTGEYRNSIEANRVSDRKKLLPVGITQTKDPNAWGIYASYIWRFIEFGTKAHVIKPRKIDVISWFMGSKLVSAKQVNHPGQSAQPHVFPTYNRLRKRIRSRIARAINGAIKKVAAGGGGG